MICELLFPSSILAVKLNRKTVVVVLENEIYIYDISNMRLMHVIETTQNPEGMSAYSSASCSEFDNLVSSCLCAFTVCRFVVPCIPISCSLTHITFITTVIGNTATADNSTVRRCHPFLDADIDSGECHTST